MNLLHIDSSILGEASVSRQLSAEVVAAYRAADPAMTVTYRDLVARPLPHVELSRLGTPEQDALIDELLAADVIVMGVPMYNFSIPSQLKAWIDHVAQRGRTFRYTDTGPEGLVTGKTVVLAASRGGLYGPGSPAESLEHAVRYLKGVLGFMGMHDVRVVVAEGVNLGAEAKETAVTAARASITETVA